MSTARLYKASTSDTITQGEELETFSNQDDEDKDPSYSPAAKKRRGHIKGSRQSLPEAVKLALENTPLGQCCTLTLDPIHKPCAVEIAHTVEATTNATRLRTLQQAWYTNDFPNVDSPLNLMYLRVDWHRLFDRNQWSMLPTDELLLEILAASASNKAAIRLKRGVNLFSKFCKDPKAPKDVSPRYEYRLLWLGGSDPKIYPSLPRRKHSTTSNPGNRIVNIAITPEPPSVLTDPQTHNTSVIAESCDDRHAKLTAYQEENGTLRAQIDILSAQVASHLQEHTKEHQDATGDRRHSTSSTAANEVTKPREFALHYDVFLPPYADFPAFESHVHPFFVIVNAGDKLSQVDNPSRFGPAAETVLEIYRLWFNLPSPAEPPQAAESERGDGDGDDQSSHTSQTEGGGSSLASGSRGTGSRKSVHVAQKPEGAHDTKNRSTNNQPVPCDSDDFPMLDPCSSSAGTPSLVHDSSVNALGSHSLNEVEELEDVDTFVSKWLSRAGAGPPDEREGLSDRELDEYRKEPSQQAEPRQWQEWASTPPKIPHILKSYHDTSRLTSYHWSLYHESVNLMAPTGSHRIPWNGAVADDPDVDREYDMYDLGTTSH